MIVANRFVSRFGFQIQYGRYQSVDRSRLWADVAMKVRLVECAIYRRINQQHPMTRRTAALSQPEEMMLMY
jgi:hypothetical protein